MLPEGLGKKKMKAEKEEQLWTRDVLGGNNAVSLVFFMLSPQFGTRGCQEHHQLHVEDLKFIRDPQGKHCMWSRLKVSRKPGKGDWRWTTGYLRNCLRQMMSGAL